MSRVSVVTFHPGIKDGHKKNLDLGNKLIQFEKDWENIWSSDLWIMLLHS